MTDTRTLLAYRVRQADETLDDAEKMRIQGLSPRSIVNRAYYAMFYAALALFLGHGVQAKISKHAGVLSLFDKEFVRPGRVEKRFSEMLHKAFNLRLRGDYEPVLAVDVEIAEETLAAAREFVGMVKELLPPG